MNKRLLILACSIMLTAILVLAISIGTTDPSLDSWPTWNTSGSSSTAGSSTHSTTGSSGNTTVTTLPTAPSVPTTGEPTVPPATEPSATQPPATEPTVPPTTVPPTTTTTQPPPPGQIRLYTCDMALAEVYVDLAVTYYKATGIEVIVQLPEEGETCTQALARYMASDTPPTMFCVHQQETLEQYAGQLYDLSGTKATAQLYSTEFGMYQEDKLLALPVAVDWFGYIYNADLLKAAFSRDDFYRKDITGYDSMKYIVKYLTSAKINSFGKPNFSDTSASGLAALISSVVDDPDEMRSLIDLYNGNSLSTTDALSSFKNKKVVFYGATTASFDAVLSLGIEKLDLLPAFTSGNTAMHYTCDYFWVVNGEGYEPDMQETVAFLNWLVSPDRNGDLPIDRLGLLSPYKNAKVEHNALEKLLRKYMAEEPAKLVWNESCVADENFTAFCAALTAYYAKPSDTTWEAVVALLKE